MELNPFLDFTKLPPETGRLKGYDWIIGNALVATTAYVKIPKGHPLYHEEEWRSVFDERVEDLNVNGGCTYWAYTDDPTDPRQGCCLGWDYGHYWDNGRELFKDEVMDDIRSAIEFLEKAKNA